MRRSGLWRGLNVGVLALAGLVAAQAQAVVFSFSFSGSMNNGYFTPGTVAGLIYGLADNGNDQLPTYARITSSNPDLGIAGQLLPYLGLGTVDVSSGAITAIKNTSFGGLAFGTDNAINVELARQFDGFDGVRGAAAGIGTQFGQDNGFAGITFERTDLADIGDAVPEAPIWVSLIAGFGLVGAGIRKRRTAAATSLA